MPLPETLQGLPSVLDTSSPTSLPGPSEMALLLCALLPWLLFVPRPLRLTFALQDLPSKSVMANPWHACCSRLLVSLKALKGSPSLVQIAQRPPQPPPHLASPQLAFGLLYQYLFTRTISDSLVWAAPLRQILFYNSFFSFFDLQLCIIDMTAPFLCLLLYSSIQQSLMHIVFLNIY